MTTTTLPRRQAGSLLFSLIILALLAALTFRTQAQTTKSNPEKGKQGATIAPGQSHAKSRSLEMDGISKAELERAQKELEKAQAELAQHDWKKVEAELALAKVEVERAMQAAQISIEKESMQKAMAEVEKNLAKHQGQLEAEMKRAEGHLKKAQEQIALMEQGMEMLEKDGLIKPGESINIEWDGDTMILNGKRQSKEVSDKYRNYFRHNLMKREARDYKDVVI